MKKKEISKLFIQFLKDENAYVKFICAFSKGKSIILTQYLKKYTPQKFIVYAFGWATSLEDNEYWYYLHIKWNNLLFNQMS